jgi:hypothetical protein
MAQRTTPADLLALYDKIMMTAVEEGKDNLVVPTSVMRELLILAKRAKNLSGRPGDSGRDRIRKSTIIGAARGKITRLMEEKGLSREEARAQVLREIRPRLEKLSGRTLSQKTIIDWMGRRKQR